MKNWLLHRWDNVRHSFWFVPVLLVVAGIFLSWVVPRVDLWFGDEIQRWIPWTKFTSPAARLTLSSIAGAMFTVTGVVFSITIVTLSTTANQFGSRLLRTMMDDAITQLAMGALLSTSLYCLLVLRLIRGNDSTHFVPHLSVTLGVVSAIVSMGILIFFIHHVGVRLQAPYVVRIVAKELRSTIDRLFPEQVGESPEVEPEDYRKTIAQLGDRYGVIHGPEEGYLQSVDSEAILQVAEEADVVIYLQCRPGAFISPMAPLIRVWPETKATDSLRTALQRCLLTGYARTPRQDVEHAIGELVEIAVRALSPGINDPFTAMTCLDYLSGALGQIATRKLPSPLRLSESGKLRAIAEPITFRVVMQCAFPIILNYGRSSPGVLRCLLEAMERVRTQIRRKEDRETVREMLALICATLEMGDLPNQVQRELLDRCGKSEQALSGEAQGL